MELYNDRRIYAADMDPGRVKTARGRFASGEVRQGDCNGWLFGDIKEPFAIADLDSYSNPYPALVSFWENAVKAKTVVVFGTDGMKQRINRHKVTRRLPGGEETPADVVERRVQYNFWWAKFVLPFVTSVVAPYRITRKMSYLRRDMLYWGIVVKQ